MGRKSKSKQIAEEAKKKAAELEEMKALHEAAVKEEEQLKEDTTKEIEALCEERGLFCGLLMGEEEMMQLIKEFISNPKKAIKVRFNLYITEE